MIVTLEIWVLLNNKNRRLTLFESLELHSVLKNYTSSLCILLSNCYPWVPNKHPEGHNEARIPEGSVPINSAQSQRGKNRLLQFPFSPTPPKKIPKTFCSKPVPKSRCWISPCQSPCCCKGCAGSTRGELWWWADWISEHVHLPPSCCLGSPEWPEQQHPAAGSLHPCMPQQGLGTAQNAPLEFSSYRVEVVVLLYFYIFCFQKWIKTFLLKCPK